MGLLTHKFTITHPSVVAVTTGTQVHVPLSSILVNINIEVVNYVICYRLSQYSSSHSHQGNWSSQRALSTIKLRVLCKLMPRKKTKT